VVLHLGWFAANVRLLADVAELAALPLIKVIQFTNYSSAH
jgi:hypothetical protein